MYKATTTDGRILLVRTFPDEKLASEDWNQGLFSVLHQLHEDIDGSSLPESRTSHGSLPMGFQHANGNGDKVLLASTEVLLAVSNHLHMQKPHHPAAYADNAEAFQKFEATPEWQDIL